MAHPALAIMKASLRMAGLILIGFGVTRVNTFLGFLMFFFSYMSLPDRLSGTDKPFEATLGIFRFVMGFVLAASMFAAFGSSSTLGLLLALLAMGIFVFNFPEGAPAAPATPPAGASGTVVAYVNVNTFLKKQKSSLTLISAAWVGTFAGLATLEIFSLGKTISSIIFLTFGILITVITATTPSRERAIAGGPILLLMLLTATSAAPETIGEPLFGVYWPQVQNAFEPVSNLLASTERGTGTLGLGFNCILDPIGCQQQFQPKTQTQATVKAVEITGMTVVGETTVTRIKQNTSVLLDVSNEGEELARDIRIEFQNPMLGVSDDPTDIVGSVDVTCPNKTDPRNTRRSCYVTKLFPGEPAQIFARYSVDLTEAAENAEFRGNFVNYKAELSYSYNVSSSLDVQLMNDEFYDDLARNNRLNIEEVPTTDSGGPVRLGTAVYNNRMPIRASLDAAPILIQITNQGNGEVVGITYAEVNVSGIAADDWTITERACTTGNGQLSFSVSENNPIASPLDEFDISKTSKRSTCIIPLKDVSAEKITETSAIVSNVQYKYVVTRNLRSVVEFGTGNLCTCAATDEQQPLSLTVGPEFCEDEPDDCDAYCLDQGYGDPQNPSAASDCRPRSS